MSDLLDYLKTNLLIATANIAKYRHLCASIDFSVSILDCKDTKKDLKLIQLFHLIPLEADNEGEMVAEAGLIAHTLKGAEGTLATILWVVLEKKGSIVDID